ncbi:MAG TPA: cobyrinate a,c-diamide synthase [Desulfobulbaceae bacterium]|nr:cobyrinate a,c-diamide synthase [Desulfobulbaceae bacterium]
MSKNEANHPAFVVAGVASGCGKTTVTLGLMAACVARGLRVMPFKCGPDFIDPGLHRLVTGRISVNLDLWMMGETAVRHSFHHRMQDAGIGIVEGVMGMFDGGPSSCGMLAAFLGLPVILVVDVRSMAESAAAVVKGFESFHPGVSLAGVILNRIGSERHLRLATDSIQRHCQTEVMGHLPRTLEFSIPSRHLGLLTSDEAPISPENIGRLAAAVEKYIDLDAIWRLAQPKRQSMAAPVPTPSPGAARHPLPQEGERKSVHMPGTPTSRLCRIAVARDQAFCFHYEDNFELLRRAGAELVFFSPLNDKFLPENICGIYLGGGYPELHAAALSVNTAMRDSIRQFAANNGVIYAECGGFMYLCQGIAYDGQNHPMLGLYPVWARMNKTRAALGYREAISTASTCFGPPGTRLRGHEFHYSEITPMPEHISRVYQFDNGHREGYSLGNILGGYLHLHFASNPAAARHFVEFCRENH